MWSVIKTIFFTAVFVVAGVVIYDLWQKNAKQSPVIDTSSRISADKDFKKIEIDNLDAETFVSSPLNIKGRASADWFSDGTLKVRVIDNTGKAISETLYIKKGDGDDQDSIAWSGTLKFDKSGASQGYVIFSRDTSFAKSIPYEYRLHVLFE